MFLGYGWYAAPLEAEAAGGWRADHAYAASLLMSGEAWVAQLLGHVPAGLARRVREVPPGINEGPEPLAFRIRRNETEHYLPGAVLAKVDRMSMQHALEVRTPYLNTDVAEFAAGLPVRLLFRDGRGKVLLRAVAARHLPRDLVALPKRGFGIPDDDWGGPTIRAIARRVLGTEDGCLRAWIGSAALDSVLASDPDAHRQWALVVLESWLRHHPAKLPELTVVPAMVTP
jgi:asparagine synthase (glutamine-hydrolysing)